MFNLLVIFGARYLLLVLVGLALVWFLKQSGENQKKLLLFGVVALPIMFAISRLLGKFYFDPRPFVTGHFNPLIPHVPDNGFPSDHALFAAAIATVIYPFSKKASLLAWLLTILIGVSRVLAGVHSPIDIAGSMAISILVGFVIYHALRSRLNQRGNKSF